MEDWLKEILASDTQGLLKAKSKSSAPTADDHLIAKFKQINDFIDKHGREPKANRSNPIELMRSKSLESIRNNNQHCLALKQYDVHGILPQIENSALDSIEAILADDMMGILDLPENSIFDLKHVKKSPEMPDKIARKEKCPDFHLYEDIFKQAQQDIDSKAKVSIQFSGEQNIASGMMFIFRGLLTYVASSEEKKQIKGKTNARLKLIFSDGTESNMLLRSFARELYRNDLGRRIVDANDQSALAHYSVTEGDLESGYIYILKSLSDRSEIREINHLYKIGYSTTPVKQRIANARSEPTYLMAPVQIVTEYECYNLKTSKFEGLLHTFFGQSCLDVKVADNHGNIHTPREWFIAPLECIKEAIQMLISGDIINYQYDDIRQEIVERESKH